MPFVAQPRHVQLAEALTDWLNAYVCYKYSQDKALALPVKPGAFGDTDKWYYYMGTIGWILGGIFNIQGAPPPVKYPSTFVFSALNMRYAFGFASLLGLKVYDKEAQFMALTAMQGSMVAKPLLEDGKFFKLTALTQAALSLLFAGATYAKHGNNRHTRMVLLSTFLYNAILPLRIKGSLQGSDKPQHRWATTMSHIFMLCQVVAMHRQILDVRSKVAVKA